MQYWLMKSEPDVFSIQDLEKRPKQTEPWDGIRNYQARNFMRDKMQVGDRSFFYHSNCPQPGISGIMEISSAPYPDATQFDPTNKYYDPKSTLENPRWINVDVTLVKITRFISLSEIKDNSKLSTLLILRRGNRLSITPLSSKEQKEILAMTAR